MSIGAHIQTKHEIEYGSEHLEYQGDYLGDDLLSWLTSHNVGVGEAGGGYEWEIDREGLKGLKDEDYADLNDFELEDVKSEVMDFVRDCLATSTGDYVYVSWF